MPKIDEAIERAAKAAWEKTCSLNDKSIHWDTLHQYQQEFMIATQRAALSAFLADVPVSENVTRGEASIAKAYCAKLAEEIQ